MIRRIMEYLRKVFHGKVTSGWIVKRPGLLREEGRESVDPGNGFYGQTEGERHNFRTSTTFHIESTLEKNLRKELTESYFIEREKTWDIVNDDNKHDNHRGNIYHRTHKIVEG